MPPHFKSSQLGFNIQSKHMPVMGTHSSYLGQVRDQQEIRGYSGLTPTHWAFKNLLLVGAGTPIVISPHTVF